jgi:hypothetical protein
VRITTALVVNVVEDKTVEVEMVQSFDGGLSDAR